MLLIFLFCVLLKDFEYWRIKIGFEGEYFRFVWWAGIGWGLIGLEVDCFMVDDGFQAFDGLWLEDRSSGRRY